MIARPALAVGDIGIWPLLDGCLRIGEPPGFPPGDSADFAVHTDYVHDGRLHMDIGGFLVRTADRLILVDAGSGPGDGTLFGSGADPNRISPAIAGWMTSIGLTDEEESQRFLQPLLQTDIRTGSLAASLAAAGFTPEDVTDVLLSHLHFDHIGWVSKDGRPFFPNAVIRCEQKDAEYFLSPDYDDTFYSLFWGAMPIAQRMAPVLDRLEPWHEDASIAPGVDCRFAPGHTPGSSIFAITAGNEQALLLGDSAHCPQDLIDPDFELGSDMDAEQAQRSRDMIRDLATDGAVPISASHFSGLRFGRLAVGGRPRQWRFTWSTGSTVESTIPNPHLEP